MLSSEVWLNVGKIVAPQGLKGELRVNPSSDFPERFTKPGKRWLQKSEEQPQEILLISGRQLPGKSIFVVRFANITNRSAAESLVGRFLLVPASDRPKLEADEFHLLDLVGLEVRINSHEPSIGTVLDLTSGGNDLLEIMLIEGRRVLIPFVKAIVPEVNLREGWLRITPPPGLLELGSSSNDSKFE